MAADLVTPEAVNFMALTVAASSAWQSPKKKWPACASHDDQDNRSPHNTAFTVSVDARRASAPAFRRASAPTPSAPRLRPTPRPTIW